MLPVFMGSSAICSNIMTKELAMHVRFEAGSEGEVQRSEDGEEEFWSAK